MATATVKTFMNHWHPHTVLVHLDTPLTYYDRETGEQLSTTYVAVNSRHPKIHSADHARIDVFPCDATGNFVEDTLVPIRKLAFQRISSALQQLGFDVEDEEDILLLTPGG